MAVYYPVEFQLNEFQLAIGPKAAAGFHGRMKELGFTGVDSKGMMVWTRHDSRICAMLQPDMGLVFLQDFYDNTPGGTIYAILEKMCVNFNGTMMGVYKIPAIGKEWGIRISQGMVIGDETGDVGQRETVTEEVSAPGGATFQSPPAQLSSSPSPAQSQASQAVATTASVSPVQSQPISGGQVASEQPGPNGQNTGLTKEKRDKLFELYVDNQFQQWLANNASASQSEQLNERVRLVRNFEQQFPKEETQEEKAAQITQQFLQWLTSKVGTGHQYISDDELEAYVADYVFDKTGSDNVEDIEYAVFSTFEAAGFRQDVSGEFLYSLRFDEHTKFTLASYHELDLSAHPGRPVNVSSSSIAATPIQVSTKTPEQLLQAQPINKQGEAVAGFNASHAVAYSPMNYSGPVAGNTPPMPDGWVVPKAEIEEAFLYICMVFSQIFSKVGGFKSEGAMVAILEHHNDLALALQKCHEGASLDEMWEFLWEAFPQADVAALLAKYKAMGQKIDNMP